MFRNRLRRLSFTDGIKATELANNETSEDSKYSYDIKLEEITSQETATKSKPSALLKRGYKLFDLIIFAISSVVGSGIYVLAGTAGRDAGAGLLVSLLFGSISAGVSALSYAQFASQFAIIGGYSYIYISSGELIAIIIGFTDILTLVCSASINGIGATGYLHSFIETLSINEIKNENILFGSYLTDIISFNIIAPIILTIFTILVLTGTKISSFVMNIATTFNISLLCFFGICMLCMFDINIIQNPCDYNNVFTNESCPNDANNSWLPFGFISVAYASTITMWAFCGSEAVVAMAQESINPTADIPKSIYITLGIVFILYEMIIFGILGMVPYYSLDISAPLAESFAVHNEILLSQICSFAAFTTMCILLFSVLASSPRILYRMAIDGLVPKYFKYVHPKIGVPFNAILIFCIAAILIAMFFDLSSVLEFAGVATLMSYTGTITGTLIQNYCPKSLDKMNLLKTQNGDIILTGFWTDMKVFKFIWLFLCICILTAFIGVNYEFFEENNMFILWIICIVLFGLIVVIQFGVIVYFDKILPWKDWIMLENGKILNDIMFVPFTPYTQCIIIMFNSYMIAASGIVYFVQWLGVVILVVLMYVLYGYKHSNMNPITNSLLRN